MESLLVVPNGNYLKQYHVITSRAAAWQSVERVADRTTQEYNLRKGRRGAGKDSYPGDRTYSSYCKIQPPLQRYAVNNTKALSELLE